MPENEGEQQKHMIRNEEKESCEVTPLETRSLRAGR